MLKFKELRNLEIRTVSKLLALGHDWPSACRCHSLGGRDRVLAFQSQKRSCISAQQQGFRRFRQITCSNQRSYVMFTQREGVIRTQHHAIGSHGSDQKVQCAIVEHGRIHMETIQVLAGRQLANAMCRRMMLPCVLQPSQQERETSSAVSEAYSQPRRQLVECSPRSEEHTSELQSLRHLVCRLLLEKN